MAANETLRSIVNVHEHAVIRPANVSDAGAIADIYNYYVQETIVTFEEDPVTGLEIARRIEEVQLTSLPWLVAEEKGELNGYAYATRWRTRFAYRYSVEVTVYVAPRRGGSGFGSKLYGQLLPMLRAQNIHAAIGGIALPNEASIALHEKFGFRKVAHFEEVGFKFDRWIDVGYWQLTL
jgi:phosphinothricin acetyltransferase